MGTREAALQRVRRQLPWAWPKDPLPPASLAPTMRETEATTHPDAKAMNCPRLDGSPLRLPEEEVRQRRTSQPSHKTLGIPAASSTKAYWAGRQLSITILPSSQNLTSHHVHTPLTQTVRNH